MTRLASQRRLALLACGWLAMVAPQAARAQAPPSAAARGTDAPIVRFDPAGIGIDEAVRLALQHDPALQQQQAAIEFATGAAQQQRGAFDVTLLASLFTEYRLQELTESRKETEREKRNSLRESLNESQAAAQEAQRVLAALQAVAAAPPGSPAEVAALTQANASLGAQVQTFDTLIATATNQTARQQFIDARNQFIADQTRRIQTLLSEQLAQRAIDQTRLANLGEAPVDEVFYSTRVNMSVQKLFRSGIGLAPFLEGGIEGTNFKDKPRSADFGGKGLEDLFTFRAGIGFQVPLLRGRGATAVAAAERAAGLEVEASRLTLEHQRTVSALAAVQAYWALRGAQESLEVATRSVELQAKIAELTKALIDAGDVPGIELSRAQAGEARARAQLEDRQRRLREARVELARAMGLLATDEDATLPRARDGFPTVSGLTVSAAALEASGAQRADVAAASKREQASGVIEAGAATELRPRLDLTGRTYFTALDEKRAGDALDRWVGPSIDVTAEFERPLGNNRAKGTVAQAQADQKSRSIAHSELQRQIRLRTLRSVQTLPAALDRVRLAEAAVELYGRTVTAEIERFKAGESTLIDTLLTEQQRTEAELALVAARQEVAQLIAQLRFESGTLLDQGAVSLPNLTTPPAGAGR